MKRITIPVLLLALLTACNCQEEQQKQQQQPASTESEPSPTNESQQPEVTPNETRIWSSMETGLPRGVITEGEAVGNNNDNNWLTIQDTVTHQITLVKDIDSRLWTAVKKGDIIK